MSNLLKSPLTAWETSPMFCRTDSLDHLSARQGAFMKTSARRMGAALIAVAVAGGVTACSSSDDNTPSTGSSGGGTYVIWDPYPQFDDSSDWVKLLQKCGTNAGVTVKRTGFDTTDLTNKALLAAQQGNSPDVLIVDNPVVSTLAEGGVLTT